MTRLMRMLTGLAVGAVGMYFLDPQQGRRRRALVRDQWTSLKTQAPKKVEKKLRHLQNQAKGVMHEFQSGITEGMSQGHQSIECQTSRMQAAAQGNQASSGDEAFQNVGPTFSHDGQVITNEPQGAGPGEAGQRAPSRQPIPNQSMEL